MSEPRPFIEHQTEWFQFCFFLLCCFPYLTTLDLSCLHVAAICERGGDLGLEEWIEWGRQADEWSKITGIEREHRRLSQWKPKRPAPSGEGA